MNINSFADVYENEDSENGVEDDIRTEVTNFNIYIYYVKSSRIFNLCHQS